MISTLQKLVGMDTDVLRENHTHHANFNANLPLNVEVLKKIDALRYRLKIGRKELTTKSEKALSEGEIYWGDFSQKEGGILTLAKLYKQPSLFGHKRYFLDSSIELFFNDASFSLLEFKELLLKALSEESLSKDSFTTLSYMLLALKKHVVHLPFLHDSKRLWVQFKPTKEGCDFYMAFENLGPIKGQFVGNSLQIALLYEKSLFFLEKALPKLDKIVRLSLEREIHPLFDAKELSLDVKG